jgi:hypothetical protein
MDAKRIEFLITRYGERVIEDYVQQLKAQNYRIADKVKMRVDVDGTLYSVVATLPDYWKYIEGGRRPGLKMPPEKPIIQWMRDKGIQPRDRKIKEKSLAFLIRRKIGMDGIPEKPYLRNAIKANEPHIEQLVKMIKIEIVEGLSSELKIS